MPTFRQGKVTMADSSEIDWTLLDIFLGGHYGFGDYRAPVWLVGPGSDLLGNVGVELRARLTGWHRRGQPEIDDLAAFLLASGPNDLVGPGARIHRLWGRLSRFLLRLEPAGSKDSTSEAVRAYQSGRLGRRANLDSCLIQLMATSPTADPWPFQGAPSTHLTSPSHLIARFEAARARHIRNRMVRHKPRLVVFYDHAHAAKWRTIADASFSPCIVEGCLTADGGPTCFMLLRHPESVGTTNDYFDRAGSLAAELMTATSDA